MKEFVELFEDSVWIKDVLDFLFVDFLKMSDLLILDYFFVLFEFVLLDKFILFYMYDMEVYNRICGLIWYYIEVIFGMFCCDLGMFLDQLKDMDKF